MLLPAALFRAQRKALLAKLDTRPDREEIVSRAHYYNRLLAEKQPIKLPATAPRVSQQRLGKKSHVYFFDTREYLRYFPKDCRWLHIPGDITTVPSFPSIVKSRPIEQPNANSVLLNLNKVRHFIFVKNDIPYEAKCPRACFRGKIRDKPKRIRLFEKYFGNPMVDLGDTSSQLKQVKQAWGVAPMSIREQLSFKFLLAIEGTDVASNLKWIMSSNSIAVMPRPQYETWFQEGLLRPGVHYIEIAPDYSDLVEKLQYYIDHPDEALAIIHAAHEWVARFHDPMREKLVSLLVLQNYFIATGQEEFLE